MNDATDVTEGCSNTNFATLKVHKAKLMIVVTRFASSLTIDGWKPYSKVTW